jgi:adenosine deaminase
MPLPVLTELLNRHDLQSTLANAPDSKRAAFASYDNIRPFLVPRRRWSADEAKCLFRYRDFVNFLYTFNFTGLLFHTADDIRLLVHGVLGELARQRVVYAEICISAIEYVARGIPLQEIVICLEEASEHPRTRVQWVVDLVRDFGPESALAQLRELISLSSPAVIGITLGGSEDCLPAGEFREVYALAREHGLRLSVHAGEALGPKSVWEALETLRPERIGHGVRAIEDPALVAHLAARQIPLEVCPTSNIVTGAYPSLEAHPVRALFEAGVPITINSDDPTFFHTTLADEYACLPVLGFSDRDVLELLRNGFRYAFLPKRQISQYLSGLDREWERVTRTAA